LSQPAYVTTYSINMLSQSKTMPITREKEILRG